MTTQCVPCDTGKCEFLGCTVMGFNGTLGWGSAESSVTVDLVPIHCENEAFNGEDLIGRAVYFSCGSFDFGGLLQNWTYASNSNGRTYNCRIIDPRSLLDQCLCVIDSYAGPPARTLNYFNCYGYYEEDVYLNKNCDLFGTAEVTERGMPYTKIIAALKGMNPIICTPVGENLIIDWSNFNIPVPQHYKIAGPTISILQLITDICDHAGYDFFVTLEPGNVVKIHAVSLSRYDPIEDNLHFGFNADEIIDYSYGKEMRLPTNRGLLIGEQQHYLTVVDLANTEDEEFTGNFAYYFGEDPLTGNPITPHKRQYGQFWVNLDIRKLNVTLAKPFPVDTIEFCEYDFRSAAHGTDAFYAWTCQKDTISELGKAMQSNWAAYYDWNEVLSDLIVTTGNLSNALIDGFSMPNADKANQNLITHPPIEEDLEKVQKWVAEVCNTYYGKQLLIQLNEKICIKPHPENFGEKLYTDVPTNDGGWVEPGIPVLGLGDPELEIFRTDDGRCGALAVFDAPGMQGSVTGALCGPTGDGGGEYEYNIGAEIEYNNPVPTAVDNGDGTYSLPEENNP